MDLHKSILLSATAFGSVYLFVSSLKIFNEYNSINNKLKKFEKEFIPLTNHTRIVYDQILLLVNGSVFLLSGGYFGYLFYKAIQNI